MKLGDKITVLCCYDAGGYPNVSLKIVGIYETQDDGEFHTTSTDKKNCLIIDHKAMREIMMHDTIQYDNGVEFFVDDPGDIDKLAAQYILETMLIAVIAFGLSYFSSGAIAQGTSNLLFSQAVETQPVVEIETLMTGWNIWT